jgi:hypothetical protein
MFWVDRLFLYFSYFPKVFLENLFFRNNIFHENEMSGKKVVKNDISMN